MKSLIRSSLLMLVLLLPMTSFAQVLSGDVTGGGTFNGSVTSSDAWIQSNAIDGQQVNFWSFTANAGDVLSILVNSSALEFGVSVYQGLVEAQELSPVFGGFSNYGDFGDNLYVAGTNPVTGAIGTSLLDLVLPTSGIYTIAVGGESGFPLEGLFAYSMDVTVAPVPLPAAVWLLGSALVGLGFFRRRV
jgi:hypothetical protein